LVSISEFINLLNSTFVVAYNNFVYYIGEIGKTLPSGLFPYFLYNPQTRLMAFVTHLIIIYTLLPSIHREISLHTLTVRNEFIPLSTGQKLQIVNPGIGTTGQPYISSIPLLIDYIVPVQQFGQKNRRIFFQQQNSEGQL